jgi:hypothetical protein
MALGNEQSREDRIRERAYEIWEREGRKDGDHERHWDEAEKEMRKKESGIGPSATPSGPVDPAARKEGSGTRLTRTTIEGDTRGIESRAGN